METHAAILLIADLHLSEQQPRLTQAFLDLLQAHQQRSTDLYVLGDWFNAWLDDADDSAWLEPIVSALQRFTACGNRVFVLVGNRDFVLGQDFLNRFGGHLLQEPHCLIWHGQRVRLEHGDALCVDDVSYQRFKRFIRHPLILGTLKRLPFGFKQGIAQWLRSKSKQRQQQRHYQIIDVNLAYVDRQMHDIDVLIHGHTHNPDIHHLKDGKQRIVLGDWREEAGEAQILYLPAKASDAWQLSVWRF